MNCLAIETEGTIIVVDCGLTFPDQRNGVSVIHADFEWLLDNGGQVRAVVLTHGHEDHIGALPFLLRDLDVPVYGPPYTLELLRDRLEEHGLEAQELHRTEPGKVFEVGPFSIEPIRVTHSIADATALLLQTPAGTIVHTGDFKIEDGPTDGEAFDAARFREAGDRGVALLLSDSTNVTVPGWTGSERSVWDTLEELVRAHPGRVAVAVFASNVHRLRSLFAIARTTGRRLCLLGRSIHRHVAAATATGYLETVQDILVEPERARSVPREQLLVVCTGTQGEPRAALTRLAEGRHRDLRLEPGDLAVLSSRLIPGNDQAVYDLINLLERAGVEVRYRGSDPGVHVSGHAHREEQRTMLQLVRPRAFLPVHGTVFHLNRHAALAAEQGVQEIVVAENGAVVELTPDGLGIVGEVATGRVHLDNLGDEIDDKVLKDRAMMGELGFALVVVELDSEDRVLGLPEIVTRGVLCEETSEELLEAASRYVKKALERRRKGNRKSTPISEEAGLALRRFFRRELGRKPVCQGLVFGS